MTDLLRTATAAWAGTLLEGKGKVSSASGALKDVGLTFSARFGDAPGSNPEELLAAAHAGCYSMKLSGVLTSQGKPPKQINTTATLTMHKGEGGWKITKVHLETRATVDGIDAAGFQAAAEDAKENCPVSVLLKPGLEAITLDAKLVS
jgi:osmotically inducible protein OsmC